jgi:hypothetical protein
MTAFGKFAMPSTWPETTATAPMTNATEIHRFSMTSSLFQAHHERPHVGVELRAASDMRHRFRRAGSTIDVGDGNNDAMVTKRADDE